MAGWVYLCEECERRGSLPRPLEGTHSSHSFDLGQGTLAEISGGLFSRLHQPIPSGRGSNNPQSLPHREAAWPATGALLYSNAGRRRAHLARRGRRAAGFLVCLYMGGTAIPKQPFHATARLSISTSAIGNVSSSSLDIRECSDGSHRRGDVSGRLTSDWSPGRTTAARLRTGVRGRQQTPDSGLGRTPRFIITYLNLINGGCSARKRDNQNNHNNKSYCRRGGGLKGYPAMS